MPDPTEIVASPPHARQDAALAVGEADMRWMALAAGLALAGGAAAQGVAERNSTPSRAWPAYLAATAPACGTRPDDWGDRLMAGLHHQALNRPTEWGIPIRTVLGSRYPDVGGVAHAAGALHAARRIGALLHARMPQATCREAQRVAGMNDADAAMGSGLDKPEAPAEAVMATVPDLWVIDLARTCRLRSEAWAERASLTPAIVAAEASESAPPASQRSARQAHLARISGATGMAAPAAVTARRVFGSAICTSLRGWPELRAADARAAAERRRAARPDAWDDVVPIR